MTTPRVLTRAEVIERLATMIRDEAYPEFGLAPPPEWASRAAAKIIDYHQPMLRDVLLNQARQEGWNAACSAIDEAIASVDPYPGFAILLGRGGVLAAIASLRKSGAEVARGDALRTEVISAVTNHLRTGCEDTPKEACAEAIWLDIEDRLRRHVTGPVVEIAPEAREEAEMDTAIFHARLAADANAVAGRPDPTAAEEATP